MIRMWAILLLAALAVPAQDDAKIKDLIYKLADDDFKTREDAHRALVAAGEAAVPMLQKELESTQDLEVKERIKKIVEEIGRTKSLLKVYHPPKPLTIRFKGKAADLLKELSARTGYMLTGDPAGEVDVDLTDAPLFKVLDSICKQLGNVVYKFEGEKTVKFEAGKWVDYPTFYFEAFRIRITKIEKYVGNAFESKEAAIAITVEGESLPGVKTLCKPGIIFERVLDENGNEFKTTDREFVLGGDNKDNNANNPFGGAIQIFGMGGGNALERRQVYIYTCPSDVKKIKVIKGIGNYYFRLEPRELKVEDPSSKKELEFEDFKLTVGPDSGRGDIVVVGGGGAQRKKGSKLSIRIAPRNEADKALVQVADKILVTDSIVAVDADGKEHKCEAEWMNPNIMGVIIVNNQVQYDTTGRWVVTLPEGVKRKDVKELRFKLGSLEKKVVPFEMAEIDLP